MGFFLVLFFYMLVYTIFDDWMVERKNVGILYGCENYYKIKVLEFIYWGSYKKIY